MARTMQINTVLDLGRLMRSLWRDECVSLILQYVDYVIRKAR